MVAQGLTRESCGKSRDRSGRGGRRRACLALILCAGLAACGKKGVLELPPDQAPGAGPPAEEPPPAEDEPLRDEG